MSGATGSEWLSRHPELQQLSDPVWHEAITQMVPMYAPPDTVIFRPSDPCQNFILLLEGTVRVYVRAETGREIVLYRLRPGELCILSLSALLRREPYPAEAVTETAVQGMTLSQERFRTVFNGSIAFREWVVGHLARRLHETMLLLQEVAFERLDARLACHLCRRFQEQGAVLEVTHQQLAVELGTTREVASRMLKELERQGCIRLHRGRIELMNEAILNRLAPQESLDPAPA